VSRGTSMHVSRRFVLAAAASATCASFIPVQAQQKGVIVGQTRPSSADMPTMLGGKNLKQWIEEIRSRDPSRRENAIRTVPHMKGAEEAIPALLHCVDNDPDSSPRVNAVMALGAIEFRSADDVSRAVDSLQRRLRDSQSIIRFQAALVL